MDPDSGTLCYSKHLKSDVFPFFSAVVLWMLLWGGKISVRCWGAFFPTFVVLASWWFGVIWVILNLLYTLKERH